MRNVIRPFRDKVERISKTKALCNENAYIEIILRDTDVACLPEFESNTMYKNMKTNKEYTLEELGL